MKLSDRKKKILQIVIDDYISNAEPVSSKSITDKYLTEISSATVRAELAGLEELGYLTQPHTSSGRVPSIEAYKLYVSELMDKSKLTQKEVLEIRKSFKAHADNLEEVVENAVKVISDLTDYTSVGYTAHDEKEKIIDIDIFRYKKTQGLLLIVTENKLINDKMISIPEQMSDGQVEEAKKMLKKFLTGKKLSEIITLHDTVKNEFNDFRDIFDSVMNAIEDYMEKKGDNVILEGENKILKHPEYSEPEKMKNFLDIVTSKDRLANLLIDDNDGIEVNIKIGSSDEKDMPEDCSLVTATYSASGVKLGTYGVIGPLRMDYQKVVSVLEGVGKILEDIVNSKK